MATLVPMIADLGEVSKGNEGLSEHVVWTAIKATKC